MPARKPIPADDHVTRFVPYSRQFRDSKTDAFLEIAPAAMELDESDKGGLSVTWIEFFGAFGPVAKRDAAIAYRESLKSKRLGPTGVFATGIVNNVLKAGQKYGKRLRVVHDPVPGNRGHAEVRHFSDEDLSLLDHLIGVFSDIDTVKSLKLP